MAAPYVGNPDFRGYLNYLGQSGDPEYTQGMARGALNFVGGDYAGGSDPRSPGLNYAALGDWAGGVTDADTENNIGAYANWTSNAYNTWNSLNGGTTLGASTSAGPSLSDFVIQKGNIYGTSREAANIGARNRQGSIQGFIDDLSSQQRGLDERGVQNELAKKQGHTSILDMVGRGVRSLGTMLGQRNAAGGSAMEQGARAYGDFGRRQMAGIGNQFEQENRQIGLGQEDLERARASGLGNFERDKANQVDSIILQARNQLAALDAAMAEANITERFQIEQEKEAIRSQVSGILSQFDPTLQQGVAGVQPTSQQARQQTAFGLANAGQGATNPFDFTTQVPAAFQNMGGSSSGLPIYTLPRRRENTG